MTTPAPPPSPVVVQSFEIRLTPRGERYSLTLGGGLSNGGLTVSGDSQSDLATLIRFLLDLSFFPKTDSPPLADVAIKSRDGIFTIEGDLNETRALTISRDGWTPNRQPIGSVVVNAILHHRRKRNPTIV